MNANNTKKPITCQGDLQKLPRALAPLIERPQWAVWRWTHKRDGTWQKPPFQAMQPDCNASIADPSTWGRLPGSACRCADRRRQTVSPTC